MMNPDEFANRTNQPNFCAHCGNALPVLTRRQRYTHRFCSSCGNPIQWRGKAFMSVTIDEATGTIVEAGKTGFLAGRRFSLGELAENLVSRPGKFFLMGAGVGLAGGGLVVIAAPLAILGAGVMATGVIILKATVVLGIASCLLSNNDSDAGGESGVGTGLLYMAAVGGATCMAGGILSILASVVAVAGWALVATGATACGVVAGHQAYLRNKSSRAKRKVLADLEKRGAGYLPASAAGDIAHMSPAYLTLPKDEDRIG